MREIDFIGHKKIYFIISSVLIVSIIACTFIFGIDLSIQFKGGTIISYSYTGDVDLSAFEKDAGSITGLQTTASLGTNFQTDMKTIQLSISSKDGLTANKQFELSNSLKEKYADNNLVVIESNDVNPSTGIEFFEKCIVAVIFATIVLIIYIGLRFKRISGWSAGVMAILSLFHDVIIAYGTFVIFHMPIDANFMAVVLTILGYSINDTLVIYDRIRENKKLLGKNFPLRELVNKSINQSLTRSLNTSITTISAMIIVSIIAYVCNVRSIISFSFPMIIGMISGVYSTLCIACPLWITWLERKGKNKSYAK